ncbi:copper-binding protein [Pseudomonas sp. NY11955]|uniref:copper-binding protein n=1 Tax=Pseudomonas sp. NY11955 TaxID=3400363 RepID=UPI003A881615
MKNLYLSVVLAFAFAAGAQAQDSMAGMNMSAEPAAHAEGTIKAIDLERGNITLAHGPVTALKWPAMTMGFKTTAQQVEGLQVGDKVMFDFRMEGSAATIVDIRKH